MSKKNRLIDRSTNQGTTVCMCIACTLVSDEEIEETLVAVHDQLVHGRLSAELDGRLHVAVGAASQQHLHQVGHAVRAGQVQHRLALVVEHVDVGLFVDEKDGGVLELGARAHVQQRLAARVHRVQLAAFGDEHGRKRVGLLEVVFVFGAKIQLKANIW